MLHAVNKAHAPPPLQEVTPSRPVCDYDAERKAFVTAGARLRTLQPRRPPAANAQAEEEQLLSLLAAARSSAVDLTNRGAAEGAVPLGKAILEVSIAWFDFATRGGLVEGSKGLRSTDAADHATAAVAALLSPEAQLTPFLLGTFMERRGFSLLGSVLAGVDEQLLVAGLRRLHVVSVSCGAFARRDSHGSHDGEALLGALESFRPALFARLLTLAGRPGRALRVKDFKELVDELSSTLSGVYEHMQVFEMNCLLNLQLAVALASYSTQVPESDAVEAVEWMASIMKQLLDHMPPQPGTSATVGALSSPAALREWVADSGLWRTLLRRSGVKTQRHMRHVIIVLLSKGALTPRDLVAEWVAAGAFALSQVQMPSRLAAHSALLGAVPHLGPQMAVELFAELSAAMPFPQLAEDGMDLLTRMTQVAVGSGFDMFAVGSADGGLSRSLALGHLLRYLHWSYQQPAPTEDLLEVARRAILHDLLPLPALRHLLPAFAAEALRLAMMPATASSAIGSVRIMRIFCGIAVDASRTAAAGLPAASSANGTAERIPRMSADAVARLCAVLPPVGCEAPLGQTEMQVWLNAFIDALACYLRLPGLQLASPQVGTLWSRLIVRPLCGLPMSVAAMQYFKLAFLASASASAALLAPLQAAPDPPAAVRLAYASIFCPSSFGDDPPPVAANFFFPEAQCQGTAVVQPTQRTSPPQQQSAVVVGQSSGAMQASAGREDAVQLARKDPKYARQGFAEYAEVVPVPGSKRVYTGFRCGARVALQRGATQKASTLRELRALLMLQGRDGYAQLQGFFNAAEYTYMELAWCGGGTLEAWCASHQGVVGAADVESYMTCQRLLRQACQAVAVLHDTGLAHGNISTRSIVLSADHRAVLHDFRRSARIGVKETDSQWEVPTAGFAAPEHESGQEGLPTPAADMYALGVTIAKAFLGCDLDVAAYPYDATTRSRALPDDRLEADLSDLIQQSLAQSPHLRIAAASAAAHPGLEAMTFLRRRGFLGGGSSKSTPEEALLVGAEHLREEHRGRRVDELIIFQRDSVFETIAKSKICEWNEETLLGEWRVVLDGESGVDGGGLRREVVSLFFEQLTASPFVMCAGEELQPSLFVGDRQGADKSPMQWRQIWATVGAMLLRALVHTGTIPIEINALVFDAAFGRIGKLPPDDSDYDTEDQWIAGLQRSREVFGDAWARSEMLDMLRRLRHTDKVKERAYRWMLSQCVTDSGLAVPGQTSSAVSSAGIGLRAIETMETMLEPASYRFLRQHCTARAGVVNKAREQVLTVQGGAVLEWALLWDIYLKYIGGGDRWLAYAAFADGLTLKGRRKNLWAGMTGEQITRALEGVSLTPDIVIGNLEFKPGYGYERHIDAFKHVLASFTQDELSMFLRFATGIARLPASRGFPGGQKLTIRFIPDNLEKLPSAHTCFWVVDVPPYEAEQDMRTKLCQAIAAPQPFALS
mmetsp:Transcript_22826/g.52217  ORF Transcript_22826/g.52217 Transcript_22826/m.52217 type:complete len:1458 (-) Transcript_22826:14-4387(-)